MNKSMNGCVRVMNLLEGAHHIIQTIEQAGGEAYIVGGAVRDMLLDRTPGDYDLASSMLPEQIIDLFPVVIPTGLEHGTVTVVLNHIPYEITTFRSEATYSDRRRPDAVTLGVSLEEDLTRRDFTINAMALRPSGRVDLFGGARDIEERIIRTVGEPAERFNEDALRMMRAFRFMSQLDFSLDEATERAIVKLAPHLEAVAIERIAIEFEKLLLGPGKQQALQAMLRTGIERYLPGMTSEIVKELAQQSFQGVSKDAVWTLVLDAGLAKDQLTRWKRSKHQVQLAVRLTPLLHRPLQDWDRYQLSDEELMILQEMTGTDYPERSDLPIRSRKELSVDGKDMIGLGLQKQQIKEALLHLEYSVVTRACPNDRVTLLKEVERWRTQSENKS